MCCFLVVGVAMLIVGLWLPRPYVTPKICVLVDMTPCGFVGQAFVVKVVGLTLGLMLRYAKLKID